MNRYLLNIAYFGKPFQGAQTQLSRLRKDLIDPNTVQGQIEIGLRKLNPVNYPNGLISSRTDSGVHAFHSTMHVDLLHKRGEAYKTQLITVVLNKYFNKGNIPIRILKTYRVPNTFNCKTAISRTYLYRLAVIKANRLHEANLLHHLPIEELDRCLFVCTNTFDVERMRDAAKLFLGRHDFRSFAGTSEDTETRVTRKCILRLDIEDAKPMTYSSYSFPECVNTDLSQYSFYNIYIQADGFLYRQVRRTVASLIAVAQGKVTSKDIKFMLEIPSKHSWIPNVKTAPAHGLFLCRVEYSESDQETFQESPEDNL